MNTTEPDISETMRGEPFVVSRESIRDFCDASLDYNPLHWDDEYMEGSFGKTNFGGIIMHGMNNFGIIMRMLTDWAYERAGNARRLETRWKSPVKPGDTITPHGLVKATRRTEHSEWITIAVEVLNQNSNVIAVGEALIELPDQRA